ncbi:MAG: hypothetical protein K6E59_00095 [Bacilli bacterium]|nr:hypothetical protein [Bacilli bacterium]
MEPWQIILLIVIFVAFFYVSLVTYVMGQMIEFKTRLKKRLRGLNLLLYERGQAVLEIHALFEEEGVGFSDEDKEVFHRLEALGFQNADEASVRENGQTVKEATSRIKYLTQANRWACKGEVYQTNVNLLEDLERNYRTFTLAYNADLLGYNYWISIPTISWIGFIFGFRPKTNLS